MRLMVFIILIRITHMRELMKTIPIYTYLAMIITIIRFITIAMSQKLRRIVTVYVVIVDCSNRMFPVILT